MSLAKVKPVKVKEWFGERECSAWSVTAPRWTLIWRVYREAMAERKAKQEYLCAVHNRKRFLTAWLESVEATDAACEAARKAGVK